MSLSSAFKVATSALLARQTEVSVNARNIAGANQPGFSRKTVLLSNPMSGRETSGVRVDGIVRAQDAALFNDLTVATAADAAAKAVVESLTVLKQTVGDADDRISPAARLADLTAALTLQAARPSDPASARDTLEKARVLVRSLNQASTAVDRLRADADAALGASVERVNELLADFGRRNTEVVQGTLTGADTTDAEDARDAVLMSLSKEIGVRVLRRENNDLVLFADSGAMLFETYPRAVTMARTETYVPGLVGSAVHVDGVPVTGDGAKTLLAGGRIAGLSTIRDAVAPAFQGHLDEIARGLVDAFRETAPTLPDQAGLFTWTGGPAVPAAGVRQVGLAGALRLNPAADPAAGGAIDTIRDGGMAGAPYVRNTAGEAGYTERLNQLVDAVAASRAFDPAAVDMASGSVQAVAAASVSWLEARRKVGASAAEQGAVILSRTTQALSNRTGVNLDEELQRMLEIEHAYGASAKLLGAVDRLFEDLLATVR